MNIPVKWTADGTPAGTMLAFSLNQYGRAVALVMRDDGEFEAVWLKDIRAIKAPPS